MHAAARDGGIAVTACTGPNVTAIPIALSESDMQRSHRCAAGAHVVFIGTTGLASMVMRGELTHSVLNQTFARHGAHSSYIMVTSPSNTTTFSTMIEAHFDSIGRPSACVILKYSVAWVGAACRRRGALVLVDSIDNHRAYSQATLKNEHYRAMDAIIVQTDAHAAMVAAWGHIAVVLPHPHGNLGGWSVADSVRPHVRGVGFVVQDSKNMPKGGDMRMLFLACCRANTTLYSVTSRSTGLVIRPFLYNCTALENASNASSSPGSSPSAAIRFESESMLARDSSCRRYRHGHVHANRSAAFHSKEPPDPTHQRLYYDSPRLLDTIDVGLVWRPGHQHGGNIAIGNRPPTRMHWWWSHGIPVIGYPMQAYLDAARRAGYPSDLLNLTSTEHVEHALHRIASVQERTCLQRVAAYGARISSPWHSSLELLGAICAVGERCGAPLKLARATGDHRAGDIA